MKATVKTEDGRTFTGELVEEKEESKRDPYLIPGRVCELSWINVKYLAYFKGYDELGNMVFGDRKNNNDVYSTHLNFSSYRPIGTEWDFIPKEYNWIATDSNRVTYAYTTEPEKMSNCWSGSGDSIRMFSVLDLPWESSLIERPVWAR